MRQGVVLPETPRDRRNLDGLEQDVRDSPLRGAAAAAAELPPRRRQLSRLARRPAAVHGEAAGDRGVDGRARAGARGGVRRAWQRRGRLGDLAEGWDFGDVNELIDRHNRWYPAESRLPMDPRTGDYALVNGRSYRREPLGARWVLERFPSPAA